MINNNETNNQDCQLNFFRRVLKRLIAPWAWNFDEERIPLDKIPDISQLIQIGRNGHWILNGVDTGILAEGRRGMSAYEVAVSQGFNGTESEWLASLKGEQGERGLLGVRGPIGITGETGEPGIRGVKGDTPTIIDDMWYISGINTGVRARGQDGRDGVDGKDGLNGVNGVDGAPGTNNYFHVAYANKVNGNIVNFSISDPTNREYIGTYVDSTVRDSTNPYDYKWQLIKGTDGEQGIPGVNGEDGKTQYLHIKYSNNKRNFTSNNGEDPGAYLGLCVTFDIQDPPEFSAYKWALIKGSDGSDGIGLSIEGHIESPSELSLMDISTLEAGDSYIADSNGHIYTWSGERWNDGGKISGRDGKSLYMHIAWANSADGSEGFSLIKLSGTEYSYMGICINEYENDPPEYDKYTWNLVKGETGAPGATGPQGPLGLLGNFKCTIFKRTTDLNVLTPLGGTYHDPVPTGWSDGIPSGVGALWSSVCTFYGDGTSSGWSTPTKEMDTSDLDIEFSPSLTTPTHPLGTTPFANHEAEGWYDPTNLPSNTTMIWRAERKVKNGVYYGNWIISRIYGELGPAGRDGNDGTSINVKGTVNTVSDLPATDNTNGDAYVVGTDLYVWVGTLWKNCGPFRGQDGVSQYIHIAWANSADGTLNFTTSPVSGVSYKYMGICVDSNVADPISPSDYPVWLEVKGLKGADGQARFKSIVFIRTNNATAPSAPTGGNFSSPYPTSVVHDTLSDADISWLDGIPAGQARLYSTTRIFTSDGLSPLLNAWTTPQPMTDTQTYDVEFSDVDSSPGDPTNNPGNWFDPVADAATKDFTQMLWRAERECVNGTWGNWVIVRIKGETGDPGGTGNGIESITEYYLASSQNTGITRTGTNGWEKTMLLLTISNRFLWSYKEILYTNGTRDYTPEIIIGVYGETGNDAVLNAQQLQLLNSVSSDLDDVEAKVGLLANYDSSNNITGLTLYMATKIEDTIAGLAQSVTNSGDGHNILTSLFSQIGTGLNSPMAALIQAVDPLGATIDSIAKLGLFIGSISSKVDSTGVQTAIQAVVDNNGLVNVASITAAISGVEDSHSCIYAKAGNFIIMNSLNLTTFSIDSNGNIKAKGNATFTGNIIANSLTLGNGATFALGTIPASGATSSNSTGFQLDLNGLLTASNANIYGTIYATSGTIGGWIIGNNILKSEVVDDGDEEEDGDETSSSITLNSSSTSIILDHHGGWNTPSQELVINSRGITTKATSRNGWFESNKININGSGFLASGNISWSASGEGTLAGWNFDNEKLYKENTTTDTGVETITNKLSIDSTTTSIIARQDIDTNSALGTYTYLTSLSPDGIKVLSLNSTVHELGTDSLKLLNGLFQFNDTDRYFEIYTDLYIAIDTDEGGLTFLKGFISASGRFNNTSSASMYFGSNDGNFYFEKVGSGNTCVHATSFSQNSDRRLKENIKNFFISAETLSLMPAVTFNFKGNLEKLVGTIAQDWLKILPEVVSENRDGTLSMNYANASMVSVISMAKEIVRLKEEIEELKEAVNL